MKKVTASAFTHCSMTKAFILWQKSLDLWTISFQKMWSIIFLFYLMSLSDSPCSISSPSSHVHSLSLWLKLSFALHSSWGRAACRDMPLRSVHTAMPENKNKKRQETRSRQKTPKWMSWAWGVEQSVTQTGANQLFMSRSYYIYIWMQKVKVQSYCFILQTV